MQDPMRRWTAFGFAILIYFSLTTPVSRAQGVTPKSVITTVAGGAWAFRGDGQPATQAGLSTIQGIALDSAGNVYVADTDNFLVEKISPTGVLTVVAGNGIKGASGDGGPATHASLGPPTAVAVDAAG